MRNMSIYKAIVMFLTKGRDTKRLPFYVILSLSKFCSETLEQNQAACGAGI